MVKAAYRNRRVLVTGHTGFKGSWLLYWLNQMGAKVVGLSLPPESPSLFSDLALADTCEHVEGDVRELSTVRQVMEKHEPEIVFHLAAQPLVRDSYRRPLETLSTNVMGTAHVLEAIRLRKAPCAVVIVTSDKCYENPETSVPFVETDPMGGHDVYSMSKGAAELVTSSYRRSFFAPTELSKHGVAVASARAGNVIGGGDWASERIVPDLVRAILSHEPLFVRSPGAIRPWQHVLEALGGYLELGRRLLGPNAAQYCEPWNFGPAADNTRTVSELVTGVIARYGSGKWETQAALDGKHESHVLRLNIVKAQEQLDWRPRWSFDTTVARTAEWYRARSDDATVPALRRLCLAQLEAYEKSASSK